MDWIKFQTKFHKSWHTIVKPFIESEECNKIYSFLKNQKGEIAPKSMFTFRSFNIDINNIKCVILLDEPYTEKYKGIQYADGVPLSCFFVEKIHPQLNAFYNAMEKEFYDLNLNIIKELNLDFYFHQGVLFLNSSLTTEIGHPGKHKGLWKPFIDILIKKLFSVKNIPIIFCGKDVYDEYKDVLSIHHKIFIIEHNLSECNIGVPWNTNNVFLDFNKYLLKETNEMEIMWVNMEVPF